MCRPTRNGAAPGARPSCRRRLGTVTIAMMKKSPTHTSCSHVMRRTCGVGSAKAPLAPASPTPPPPLGSRVGRLPGDGEPPSGSRLQGLCSGKGRTGEKTRGDPCADCIALRPSFGLVRRLAPLHLHLVRVTLRSQSRLLVRHSFSSGGHESSNALAVLLRRYWTPVNRVPRFRPQRAARAPRWRCPS